MTDRTTISKQELLEFLDAQQVCVLSTQGNEGYPNSATVAFSNTRDLAFVIGTSTASRKAANIRSNPKVAMNITHEFDRLTVQLEGDARELTAEEFNATYATFHFQKLPQSLPYKDITDQVYILITPVCLKMSDVSVKPWIVVKFMPK